MQPKTLLKQYFGYDDFREGQEAVIRSLLARHDVMAVMPTGAGKSICYQIPALMFSGITIVISPLISLMQDQVKALNAAGIHAAYINSSLTERQIAKAMELAEQGVYKIIYAAPERLETAAFLRFSQQVEISMVAVDESHCISQWGQDFRPSYRLITDFIRRLPVRPVVGAFTATATTEVREDIVRILVLEKPDVFVTGFDRPNLYFQVEQAEKQSFIENYVREHADESGIIYCATRKNTDAVFEMLVKKGIAARRYHAGMSAGDRMQSQNDFIYDRASVIAATNAFGMGIDKADVRYVIHYNMPSSMENYYQEAGRAGRDGEAASCILLFSAQDVMIQRMLLESKQFEEIPEDTVQLLKERDLLRLRQMEHYCQTTECLRNYILQYFGEETDHPCDNCGNCNREISMLDMTAQAKIVVNCVYEAQGRYGLTLILSCLRGADTARIAEVGMQNYRTYGALKEYSDQQVRALLTKMILLGYLQQTNERYSVLRVGDIAALMQESTAVMVPEVQETKHTAKARKKTRKGQLQANLTEDGNVLFEELRRLRASLAKADGVPPYIICGDRSLVDMCVKLPTDPEAVHEIYGFGENKAHRFGEVFSEAVHSYLEQHEGAVTCSLPEPDADASAQTRMHGTGRTGAETEQTEQADKKRRTKTGNGTKKEKTKKEFFLTLEEAERFAYSVDMTAIEVRDGLLQIHTPDPDEKKLTGVMITEFLLEIDLLEQDRGKGKGYFTASEKGRDLGIEMRDVTSRAGNVYQVPIYPEKVQKIIVQHFMGKGLPEE
ncbi:MAG: DNA helicase RecQ [Eubacteriales bacterium]|nr:DNA helicase RecQ [Eubacteriales bacterium]